MFIIPDFELGPFHSLEFRKQEGTLLYIFFGFEFTSKLRCYKGKLIVTWHKVLSSAHPAADKPYFHDILLYKETFGKHMRLFDPQDIVDIVLGIK